MFKHWIRPRGNYFSVDPLHSQLGLHTIIDREDRAGPALVQLEMGHLINCLGTLHGALRVLYTVISTRVFYTVISTRVLSTVISTLIYPHVSSTQL